MTTPTTNPAWTIPATATSTADLTLLSKPIPNPAAGQVLIKLTAASLNYRDILIASRSPEYPGPHKPSLIPAADGAGTIFSVGPGSSWAGNEGLLVVLHPNTWMTGNVQNMRLDEIFGGASVDGTLQNWIVLDDARVIEAPRGWSAEESSTLLTAGAPAWSALRGGLSGKVDMGEKEWKVGGGWKEKTLEGKWVLTQGTGGVSCFAIQIATALGATVIATSSSAEKLEVANKLGAKYLINYKTTPNWDEEVLRITGGRGVDHVVEVGGAQTLLKSLNSTRKGGVINVIGILSGSESLPAEVVPAILFGGKIVNGCVAFSKQISEEWTRFAEANEIKPVIARTFEFEEAREAFERMKRQDFVGKIVVRIGGE